MLSSTSRRDSRRRSRWGRKHGSAPDGTVNAKWTRNQHWRRRRGPSPGSVLEGQWIDHWVGRGISNAFFEEFIQRWAGHILLVVVVNFVVQLAVANRPREWRKDYSGIFFFVVPFVRDGDGCSWGFQEGIVFIIVGFVGRIGGWSWKRRLVSGWYRRRAGGTYQAIHLVLVLQNIFLPQTSLLCWRAMPEHP